MSYNFGGFRKRREKTDKGQTVLQTVIYDIIISRTAQSSNGHQKAQIYVSKNGPEYEIVQS
jgi:hypothetical protein